MIVLAVILALALTASLGLNGWLVYGRVDDAHHEGDARVAQVATEAEQERTAFELDVTKKALTAANMRASALEEELKHALEQPRLGAGLAASDASGRVLRIVGKWGEAAAARSPLASGPDEALSVESATDASGPVVHPE